MGPDGELWATHTEMGGLKWGVMMGARLGADYTMQLSEAGLDSASTAYFAYEANATGTFSTGGSIDFKKTASDWDFQVWAAAPALSTGWVLLGEQDKWVPVSNARFSNLQTEDIMGAKMASVTVRGGAGEKISVSWLPPQSTTPLVVDCIIPEGHAVLVQVSTSSPGLVGKCVSV
jgi:hypothetical protein